MLYVCMLYVCMFVCMYVCWMLLSDRTLWNMWWRWEQMGYGSRQLLLIPSKLHFPDGTAWSWRENAVLSGECNGCYSKQLLNPFPHPWSPLLIPLCLNWLLSSTQKKQRVYIAIYSTTEVHQNSFQAPKQFRHTFCRNHGVNNLMFLFLVILVFSIS